MYVPQQRKQRVESEAPSSQAAVEICHPLFCGLMPARPCALLQAQEKHSPTTAGGTEQNLLQKNLQAKEKGKR